MAQHLCIVARNNPLLLGYLNIALQHLRGGGDDLEIVIDRRPPASADAPEVPVARPAVEQRRLGGMDAQLQARGYAIVSREEGEPWRLAAGSEAAPALSREIESPDAAGEPGAALDLSARRETLRRLPVGSAAVVAVIALAAWLGIPGSAMDQHARVASSVLSTSVVAHAPAPTTPAPAAATVPPRVREGVAAAPAPARVRPEPVLVSAPAAAPAPVTSPREEITPRAPVALARAELTETPIAPARVETASKPTAAPARVDTASKPTAAPARVETASKPTAAPARVETAPRPTVASARVETAPKPTAASARVETAPTPKPTAAPATTEAPTKASTRTEKARPPSEETAVAAPPAPPVEFQGVPRVEMSRERDASGRTATILVRLTDQGGRPLSAAEVRVRRLLTGGAVNETRLEATAPEGSYRGRLPTAAQNSTGLTMRISIGGSRHEVPLAE